MQENTLVLSVKPEQKNNYRSLAATNGFGKLPARIQEKIWLVY